MQDEAGQIFSFIGHRIGDFGKAYRAGLYVLHGGIQVGHAAYAGVKALDLVRQERPDLVILDVVMPELDGYRVLNRIKTDPELWDTPVVMLSSFMVS